LNRQLEKKQDLNRILPFTKRAVFFHAFVFLTNHNKTTMYKSALIMEVCTGKPVPEILCSHHLAAP